MTVHRPTGTSVTIPSAEGNLAGTYKTTASYNLDGTILQTSLPAAGDLRGETLSYGYDTLGSLATLCGLSTMVTGTTYSKIGQILQQMRSAGTSSRRVALAVQLRQLIA